MNKCITALVLTIITIVGVVTFSDRYSWSAIWTLLTDT